MSQHTFRHHVRSLRGREFEIAESKGGPEVQNVVSGKGGGRGGWVRPPTRYPLTPGPHTQLPSSSTTAWGLGALPSGPLTT